MERSAIRVLARG